MQAEKKIVNTLNENYYYSPSSLDAHDLDELLSMFTAGKLNGEIHPRISAIRIKYGNLFGYKGKSTVGNCRSIIAKIESGAGKKGGSSGGSSGGSGGSGSSGGSGGPTIKDGICCSQPVEPGWIKIDYYWTSTKCGKPTSSTIKNVCKIQKYSALPVGATLNVCEVAPTPPGWIVVETYWDPLKCGSPTSSSAKNMEKIKRVN